ncbi:acetyl-CoA hydrolase/transferase family protein [Granulicoccus sp. GXG6511]|uniref:acetyl-CoA hydrolase/transferase family protein n=1 Tax=Granulicoccus sp. GXG6511 TaxID=3381351 RepID=UPI003D7C7CF8
MSVRSEYAAKLVDPATAVSHVHDGDTIVVPIGAGEPPTLLEALSARRHELRKVTVFQLLAIRDYDYFDPDTVENIRHATPFVGGASRRAVNEGWADFVPAHFSELPGLIRSGQLSSDVVFAQCSPMDEHGFFALGLSTDYTLAAVSRARTIVLEVNDQLPFTFGNCHVHVSKVAAVVESEHPVVTLPSAQVGDVEKAIARNVADLIPDGATLQIGIGGIPDAVVAQLMSKNDLGLHTEMLGDGPLALIEAGVVTNNEKNVNRGKAVATFALGSEKLYEWMNRNPAIEMRPVDEVNAPPIAALNDNLHSINSTMAIDLMGQCASEGVGSRAYSGTGGQFDFIRAANISKGGRSIIAVPSTAKGGTLSTILVSHAPGTPVTALRSDVNYVCTEFGTAKLRGASLHERAEQLISIAHPDFRDQLTEQAKELRVLHPGSR